MVIYDQIARGFPMESDRVISAHLQALKQAHLRRIIRIVCSGGAKGVVYPGAHKGMEETGVWKQLKYLLGPRQAHLLLH